MSPMLIVFVTFALLPVLWLLWISLTDYNGFSNPIWVGVNNYILLLGDVGWWRSVVNTLIFALGTVGIQLPLAIILAVMLDRGLRFSTTFRTVYFVPYITSMAVMGIIFFFLLRPHNGVINGLLIFFGLIDIPIDFLGSRPTALMSLIGVGVWANFGFSMVLVLAGLQTIPSDVYEAAAVDGANEVQRFRRITLPLLGPVLTIIAMLAIVFSLRSFDIVKTLTDGRPGGSTHVMFTYMFDYFFGIQRGAQIGYASALAVTATIIIGVVSLLYFWISRRSQP